MVLSKTTNEGKLIIDLSNTLDSQIDGGSEANEGITNQNGGTTTIRLLNAKYSGVSRNFINSTNNKNGLEFEIGLDSSVAFTSPSFSNAYIHFKDGGNNSQCPKWLIARL